MRFKNVHGPTLRHTAGTSRRDAMAGIVVRLGEKEKACHEPGNAAGGDFVKEDSSRSRMTMSAKIRGSLDAVMCEDSNAGGAIHQAVWFGGAAFASPTISSCRRT